MSPFDETDEPIDYTGLPYYYRVIDDLDGDGWESYELPDGSVFRHEEHPGIEVRVRESDEHPIWSVHSRGCLVQCGSSVSDLQGVLSQLPSEEVDF